MEETPKEFDQNNYLLNQAIVERYKFILSEMSRLNENTHKHTRYLLTIFPAFASAIIAVKVGIAGLQFDLVNQKQALLLIMVVLTLASTFAVVSVLSDIASWLDYRKEEFNLVTQLGGQFRKPPSLKNFWRWYETYLILFVTTYLILTWLFYFFWTA